MLGVFARKPQGLMLLVVLTILALGTFRSVEASKTLTKFSFDTKRSVFLKDGEPFDYVSGSLHYFRVPHQLWHDRLLKLRASGINVVSTFVAWNVHEPHVGQYKFDGDADLIKFIEIAKSVGLYVNIRPGPYIGAEWDLGGLPYFTLGTPKHKIVIRSNDDNFMEHVERYFSVLLPKLKPYLYENGGPIILVQVENEHGNYKTCDQEYMEHLTKIMRQHLGKKVVLYTADMGYTQTYDEFAYYLVCGLVDDEDVLVTLNLGPKINHTTSFNSLRVFNLNRQYQEHAPLVNSEYYTGWLDYWNHTHHRTSTDEVTNVIGMFNSTSSSFYVNFYMFFGGTNFGFYNGAHMWDRDEYLPHPTSYDYDAPMSECGDLTPKYMAIRDVIKKYRPNLIDKKIINKVKNSTKKAYGNVKFTDYVSYDNIKTLSTKTLHAQYPNITFEELQQDYGFVLYEISYNQTVAAELKTIDPRDRVYVFTDGDYIGNIYRSSASPVLKVPPFKRLSLLVENMGRINFGSYLEDYKGILGRIQVGDVVISYLDEWDIWCLPLNNTADAQYGNISQRSKYTRPIGPGSLLRGEFTVHGPVADTWINMDKFTKGVLYINDKNLGRYWPAVGPQKHLYVPSVWLKEGTNYITLFEVEKIPEKDLSVDLVNYPDIG